MKHKENNYRIERDSMGEVKVPSSAYYAAQTQRAVENFPISDLRFDRNIIRALGIIKKSAAIANRKLDKLDDKKAKLIIQAAEEVTCGKLDEHFVVDVFQTGSGTSSNMNANEVIANRAKEISGNEIDIHPNDHVNKGQSSNDVIPTAIHIAGVCSIREKLLPNLEVLANSLAKKTREFDKIVKTGRTHLQDATPIRLGQEFSAYEAQVRFGIERLQRSLPSLEELALGGTAVGTGLNTHPEFPARAIKEISKETGFEFREARNHFEAQAARDAVVEVSSQLKTVAISMGKIANDIRWLASGPRCGIGELNLPEVQPGSSIMPGKVNPVICESVLQVVAQVIGTDAAIAFGNSMGSTFELNVMMPIMGYNLLQAIKLLANSAKNLATKSIDGIGANSKRLHDLAEASIATCTSLAPIIGYDKSAKLAKEAFKTGNSVRDVARKMSGLSEEELNKALDLLSMTEPSA